MGRTELARRGDIDFTRNLACSAEVAWPVLARLVAPGTWLYGGGQLQAIEEIGGRQ